METHVKSGTPREQLLMSIPTVSSAINFISDNSDDSSPTQLIGLLGLSVGMVMPVLNPNFVPFHDRENLLKGVPW